MRVLSSNTFVPYSGSSSLYVVGEVRNDLAANVQFVKITAILRDAGGNIVDTDYTYSMIDILTPGMKSPFREIFLAPPVWSTCELRVTWRVTSDVPYPLDVLYSAAQWTVLDGYKVVGEVRNQYGEERTFIKAFVTLYDHQGQVIGIDYTYLDPYDLAPGQTGVFDCEVYFWKGKPNRGNVGWHELQVLDD